MRRSESVVRSTSVVVEHLEVVLVEDLDVVVVTMEEVVLLHLLTLLTTLIRGALVILEVDPLEDTVDAGDSKIIIAVVIAADFKAAVLHILAVPVIFMAVP